MTKEEIERLKSELHSQIDKLDDETALQMLQEAVATYSSPLPNDIPDELTPEQLQRLQSSIQQSDEGNTLSNEEVKQQAKEWLSK